MKVNVLNFGHLDFDIVSDFDIRISDLKSRATHMSCLSKNNADRIGLNRWATSPERRETNMQNKANFPHHQMNVSAVITMNYEQRTMNYEIKNKANQTQPVVSLPALYALSVVEGSAVEGVESISAFNNNACCYHNFFANRRFAIDQPLQIA